jgi:predicted short-subunit dehydrogenase-like oxidoreductase (DUF2520 family)
MTKIVLLGAGHLAIHFYEQITACPKLDLIQWYNRSIEKIGFAKKQIKITDQMDELEDADIYLICVKDEAIESISEKIKTGGLAVHCAGGIPLHELKVSHRKGVFYPLQTFTKERSLSFDQLPFCIEAIEKKDQNLLCEFAKQLGGIPHVMNSEKRAYLHMIAVWVNNFSNHMLHLGSDLSKKYQIPFQIFHPIIEETFQKALSMEPQNAQTGPAVRQDHKTIKKHLDLISGQDIKNLYLNLSTSIQKKYEQ